MGCRNRTSTPVRCALKQMSSSPRNSCVRCMHKFVMQGLGSCFRDLKYPQTSLRAILEKMHDAIWPSHTLLLCRDGSRGFSWVYCLLKGLGDPPSPKEHFKIFAGDAHLEMLLNLSGRSGAVERTRRRRWETLLSIGISCQWLKSTSSSRHPPPSSNGSLESSSHMPMRAHGSRFST